jgi:hypothetical protein
MKREFLICAIPVVLAAGCKSEPLYLRTYDGDPMAFPDDLPNDRPSILAFLNMDDRTSDRHILPLRGLAARDGAKLYGVMTYSDNSFLQQITTQREIVFPVMLDPNRKMVDRMGVRRFPTYILLSVDGKEVAREYDVNKVYAWYRSAWIDRAMNRRHIERPEDKVDE